MTRKVTLLILLGLCGLAGAPLARAQEAAPAAPAASISSMPTDFKRFSVDAHYDYVLFNDLKAISFSGTGSSPTTIEGSLNGMRVMGTLTYRPAPGVEIMAFGGSAFLNDLVLTGANSIAGPVTQTTPMDSAALYGVGAKVDVFPNIRFHLGPRFRALRTDYGSTRTVISNPGVGCTYDFTQNNNTVCSTVSGYQGGGYVNTRFSQTEILARLEASVDIVGDINAPYIGIIAGVEESMNIVYGGYTFTPPLSTTPATEVMTLMSKRTEGFYVGLYSYIGPVRLFAEARGLAITSISGSVGAVF